MRSLASIGVTFVALLLSLGASGAAWGFLAGALVAPVSIRQTSRICGASMSRLVNVPVKVLLAIAVSLTAYSLLVRVAPGGPVSAFAAATFCAMIFLGISAGLNAGAICHSIEPVVQQGRIGKTLIPMLYFVRWLLSLRERARLLWFSQTMRVAIACTHQSNATRDKVLVVPADTSDLAGSLGDEVLLQGLDNLVGSSRWALIVDEGFHGSSPVPDQRLFPAWNGLTAGWRLGRVAARLSAVYVVGADVMDGFYRPEVSQKRLRLLNRISRAGVPCTLTGLSFNECPHPRVLADFRDLPDSVRICLRDPVSLERFERLTGRHAILTADLAFLVGEAQHSPVAKLVSPWAAKERDAGRRLVGINIGPHVVAHLSDGSEDALADSVATCCLRLISEGYGIVLIPHDFRPSHTDLRALKRVAGRLAGSAHFLFLEDPFTGREIRSACRELDLILSARMHLAIGALSVGVPACGIQYQGKFEGLLRHFGFGADVFIAPEDAMDSTKLHRFMIHQLDRLAEMRAQVEGRLPAVCALAALNTAVTYHE